MGPKTFFVERIRVNNNFLEENLPKALAFFQNVILPELLGRFYTLLKNREVETYCFCREAEKNGNMVICCNEGCAIKLFHIECVQFDGFIEDGAWLCDACSELFDADLN